MPIWGNGYTPTSSTSTCGQGGLYNYAVLGTQTVATTCNTYAWVTNNTTIANTATTTAWYSPAQDCYYIDNQRLLDAHQATQWYQNQYQAQLANQAQLYQQPQISRQEQERRNAQRERTLYEKAIAEHNDQEVARLRRLIDAREQAAAAQRAIDERNRIEREQREAQRRVEYEAEQRRRAAADIRAKELLLEHLTEEQRDTFQKNNWFIVEGGRTKQKYRIRSDSSLVANIDVMDASGVRSHRLCAHARSGSVPLGDQLLAQKITLENDEDAFLRIANRHAA